tara:strand:+ start:4361 stop:5314 length:954 start_codon:yes stop_codon:yes gene_type:complete
MTARTPLYYTSDSLVEMTSAELVEWQRQAIFQYASDESVVLTVNAGNGNIGTTMNDTRFRSSAATQQNSSHATPGALDTVTTAFNHIVQTVTNPSVTGDTDNVLFPVYWDNSSGSILAMSETDFADTFIKPALVLMQASSEATAGDYGGTYTISTGTSLSNHTNVSTTAVFVDTIAVPGSYSSGQIGSSGSYQDHNSTVNSYYLHVRDGVDNTPARTPLHADTSGNLNEYAAATFKGYLKEYMKDLAASDDVASGHNIRFNINGSGNSRGTAMVDSKLDGSGTDTNRFVGGDDYRSQKFPSGSSSTVSTYNFKMNLE